MRWELSSLILVLGRHLVAEPARNVRILLALRTKGLATCLDILLESGLL
jgi:hypothetical protein